MVGARLILPGEPSPLSTPCMLCMLCMVCVVQRDVWRMVCMKLGMGHVLLPGGGDTLSVAFCYS